jgi:hypothetical protein
MGLTEFKAILVEDNPNVAWCRKVSWFCCYEGLSKAEKKQKCLLTSVSGFSKCEECVMINPLKMKRICFIEGLSVYHAVNTLHFGYKNQSLNVL